MSGRRFSGEFYSVDGLQIPPTPVQRPHPPLVIGGGSPKILSLAAREADIVGITTRALPDGSKDAADMTAAATERKIGWVREAAGDRFDQIELNIICPTVEITDDRRAAAERLAADLPVTAEDVLDSPVVLIGTRRRDRGDAPGTTGALRLLLHRRSGAGGGGVRPGRGASDGSLIRSAPGAATD